MLVAKKMLILKSRIKIFKKRFQEKILLLFYFILYKSENATAFCKLKWNQKYYYI